MKNLTNIFIDSKASKTLLGLSLLLFFCCESLSASISGLDTYTREKISLNGTWQYIVDPYENGFYDYRWTKFEDREVPGNSAFFMDAKMQTPTDLIEYDFDKSYEMQVPGDWNTQDQRLYYYEGTVWLRKKFDAPNSSKDNRVFLNFGAVNYRADVYLNGKKLGMHKGGFTPFYYEVTDKLKATGNSLVVKVDNKRGADEVPTLNTDWWNYGGITRDVDLMVVPKQFIQNYQLKVKSVITGKVSVSAKLNGEKINNQQVTVKIPELNINATTITNAQGEVKFDLTLDKFTPWSPDTPKMYAIQLSTLTDQLSDNLGLRTVTTHNKDVLLNGKKIFLKGISIHEEYAVDGGGRVKNASQAEYLLKQAKALNGNFVRLAHYPHNEDMVRLAEKLGLMVWSEVPVYWTISWEKSGTYENAEQQLTTMVERDINRASVIIWSIANETPVNKARTNFLTKLAHKVRSLDDTRLISAAMEKHYSKNDSNIAEISDPLAEVVDIISFNQYIGWYDGLPEKLDRVSWNIPYNKPVFISEFGGGAQYGLHGDKGERWTEEFQAELYKKTLSMLDKIEGWAGVSPWILMDFRSPRRLHGEYQKDFNRKGLMSEKGDKKQAYYVLKEFYQNKK